MYTVYLTYLFLSLMLRQEVISVQFYFDEDSYSDLAKRARLCPVSAASNGHIDTRHLQSSVLPITTKPDRCVAISTIHLLRRYLLNALLIRNRKTKHCHRHSPNSRGCKHKSVRHDTPGICVTSRGRVALNAGSGFGS